MSRFIIPQGEPHLKVKYYHDQSRRSWDLAAAARTKFAAYKRALRRFNLSTNDADSTRVLLSQVNIIMLN